MVTERHAAQGQGSARPLADHDLPGRLAPRSHRGALADRGPGERFRLYVERAPLSTLKPGDIVIMDNLGSHKGKIVRRAIRSIGAKLFFLPKYSPDLNPIEQVFAKLRHLLRKAAARRPDAVSDAIGQILETFTPQECLNYFRNSGYAQS
jgi:putative transposase